MNRIQRGVSYAIKAAELSAMNHRVGAAIFHGPRLISIGWNDSKTTPLIKSPTRWHHAESSALTGTRRYDLCKADIFVVRLGKDGSLKMAKPCKLCEKLLRAACIKRVYFSNYDGEIEKLTLG